ncbi:MAG: amphi-Trp domain-containing protein [Candidatus Aenigmatarchaeota archaeon]
MELKKDDSNGKKTITGNFSQEFYMERKEVSDLLRNLANEIEEGNKLKISTEEWELPFKFRDQIEVEIDVDHDELEIELEFDKLENGSKLSVN